MEPRGPFPPLDRAPACLCPSRSPLPPPPSTRSCRDTLGLADRLRADTAWLARATSPRATARSFSDYVAHRILDPSLWIGVLGTALRVVLIVLAAHLVIRGVARAGVRYNARFAELPPLHPRRQRVSTLTDLLASAVRYVVWPLAVISVLGQVGLDVRALLATAGIAGLAIGFGAQTLVRDLISGIFLLFDDSLHVGDTVRIGADEGTVEYIGVRLIKVRRLNGELLMVPAGELRIFGNRSIGFARAVVDVALPYTAPLRPMLAALDEAARRWAETHADLIQGEPPEVQAVTELAEPAARARIVVTTPPGLQWSAERSLRVAVLEALAEAGHTPASTVSLASLVPSARTDTPARGIDPTAIPDA